MDRWTDEASYRDVRTYLTRPDTRPSVAYGRAGAVMLNNRRKRYFYESVMDRRTDGPTDRRTDTPSYRVACTRLKTGILVVHMCVCVCALVCVCMRDEDASIVCLPNLFCFKLE